VPAHGAFFI